jgi:hypothetical protein
MTHRFFTGGTDLQSEKCLKDLTFDEIKSLQAIMYLGRDKDYDQISNATVIYKFLYICFVILTNPFI